MVFNFLCLLLYTNTNGLNGCETVRDMKNALELLKIENPKRTFQERVRAGEFDDTSEDEYRQIVDAVEFIATLWRYPDVKVGGGTGTK